MAEHGHGGGPAEHGGHKEHGSRGKEKKEGFLKTVATRLRGIFSVGALFTLSLFVSESIAKPIMLETARGAITTPATLAGSGVTGIELGGGGKGYGHGGGHAGPAHHH